MMRRFVSDTTNFYRSTKIANILMKYVRFQMAKLRCIELMTDAEVIFANEKKLSDYFCTEKMSLIDIFTAVHSAVVLFRRAIKVTTSWVIAVSERRLVVITGQ